MLENVILVCVVIIGVFKLLQDRELGLSYAFSLMLLLLLLLGRFLRFKGATTLYQNGVGQFSLRCCIIGQSFKINLIKY